MTTYNVTISQSGDDHQDAIAEGQAGSLAAAFEDLAKDVERDPHPLQAALDEGATLGFSLVQIP